MGGSDRDAEAGMNQQWELFPEAQKDHATPRPPKRREATAAQGDERRWDAPLAPVHPRLHLGLCSFTDLDWRGSFYGEDESDLLAAYSKRLSYVEVDSTFYGVPKRSTVDGWLSRTPPEFRFALKFPREITHERMLEGADYVTQAFLDSVSRLGDRLGPLLLQFPYGFRATRFPHLAAYLEKLPKQFRYAVEIRHRSWLRQPFFDLLEANRAALCLIDHPFLPRIERRTTDFVYVRWLGDRRETPGPFTGLRRDPSAPLRWWAKRLRSMLDEVKEIYAFANNHYAGHAPATLKRFAEVYRRLDARP
jgi:uncharacterized protein YecE (DUF72 family)